ncbi:nicotinic acid mononucleotide adenyltransferase [Bacteroidota bacterium]
MKKLMMIVFVMTAFVLNAQDISANNKTQNPVYEKAGELVKVTKYYSTGEVREQGFYDAEKKLTGKWIQFNKDGKKTTIAHYYKGTKVGKWFVWKGETLLEVDYEASRIASVNEWKGGTSVIADN